MALNLPSDKELLRILVCPKCKGNLVFRSVPTGLYCEPCRLLYPVRSGIPVLLTSEAIRQA